MSDLISDLAGGGAPRHPLAHSWWALQLRGIFAILFGLAACLCPCHHWRLGAAVRGLHARGRCFCTDHRRTGGSASPHWGALIAEGLIDLLAAAVAFFAPILTILVFVYLVAIWASSAA